MNYRMITNAKRDYYSAIITEAGRDSARIFSVSKGLTGICKDSTLPTCVDSLAEPFSEFFMSKIVSIRNELKSGNVITNIM